MGAKGNAGADVIAKLNAAAVDALADTNVRARLADLGQELPALDQQTPQALRVFQKAEDREMVAAHQSGQHQGRMNNHSRPPAKHRRRCGLSGDAGLRPFGNAELSACCPRHRLDRLVEAGHPAKSDERPILALPNDGNVRFSNPGHASPQQM
jgi:hypothetical protein